MSIRTSAPALAGGVALLVSSFGGHRIRFAPDDGLGSATPAEPAASSEVSTPTLAPSEAAPSADPLADALSKAWDAAETKDGDSQQEGSRTRGPDGKFTSTSKPAPAEGQPEEGATEQQTTDPTKDKPAAEAPPAVPDRWSAEEKAEFQKLTPEVQAAVLRREADRDKAFHGTMQKIAGERKFYTEMQPVMQTVGQLAQQFRKHPGEVVQTLLDAHFGMQRDPVATLRKIASDYGVDVAKLTDGAKPEAGNEPHWDPAINSIQTENATLKQQLAEVQRRLQTFEGHVQHRAQAEQAARAQSIHSTIQAFRDTKGDDGAPKYAHFDAVRDDMAILIEQGRAKDLASAYDMAVFANPQTRALMLEAQRKADEAKRTKEIQDAAARASKAGKAAVGTAPAPGRAVAVTLDDALESAWNAAAR